MYRNKNRKYSFDNYESFYVHFTDQSNKDYFYRLASIGYFEITCCIPTFSSNYYKFIIDTNSRIVGSMKDTSYVIIYVYYSTRIYFLYINYNDNNRVIRSVVTLLIFQN